MIPKRFGPVLFALLLSFIMSGIVSFVSTLRAIGFPPEFLVTWVTSRLTSWILAGSCVLVLAPLTQKMVAAVTR